jgi:cell division protein FtsI (penicillin-binding protein 3)
MPQARNKAHSRKRAAAERPSWRMAGKAGSPSRSSRRRPSVKQGSGRDWTRIRMGLVAVLMGLAWLGLWARAYQVQMVQGPGLAQMAHRQHVAAEFVSGERGQIVDRNGRLLAKSVPVQSVYARPLDVAAPARAADVLSRALDLPRSEVAARLRSRENFVWIARQIGDRAASAVSGAGLKGVHLTTEYGRLYPNRHLAGRLLGFVGVDNEGLEGLERSFEEHLAGRQARVVVQRDAAGNRMYLDASGNEVEINGRDLTLTLDAHIQFVAEEALAKVVRGHNGRWGGALVVDVPSGEILAWAEYPHFNPNAYRDARPGRWRNRLAMDVLEPGSTIKPFLMAAALQEGVCDRDTLYYCENGRFEVSGIRIKDTHKYEWLPAHKVLRYSSNIGMAKIGAALGAATYYEYLTRLGLGRRTGLPLPGESRGILRQPGAWREIDLANASFGQSLAVTMPQLAQAYLALANGGVFTPLRLVRDPAPAAPPAVRVFDEAVAEEVLAMLRDVVEEDGTGARARIPGMEVGGKTGTAQKASPQGGYGEEYVASFVGFIPAHDPQYLIAVLVDEPAPDHYGGVVAAPAFQETAVKTLAYLGRLPDTGALVAQTEDTHARSPQKDGGNAAPGAQALGPRPSDDGAVPDVVGLPLRRAVEIFARRGLVPVLQGEGVVVSKQRPAAGNRWPEPGGESCVLWLADAEPS